MHRKVIELLKQIGLIEEINVGAVLTGIVVIILIIPLAVESWQRLLNSLGLVTKKSLQQQEHDEEIESIYEKINDVRQSIVEKQEEYHEQSITIRNKLAKEQNQLKEEIKGFKGDIKELSDLFKEYMKVDKERTIATLRTTLWKLHKDFIEQGYVTPDGLKTFKELGAVYEAAGGDDIYHEKLEPEVLALEIHYPDGSIYKQ